MRKLLSVTILSLVSMTWSVPVMALLPEGTVATPETETFGAPEVVTEVTWNSDFLVTDYDCARLDLTREDLEIMASPVEGAEFDTFLQRKNTKREITPASNRNKPKAKGQIVAEPRDEADTAMIQFSRLHYDADLDRFHGTAHLWWQGRVDEDPLQDGLDATAKFGVNVHVERPGEMGNCGP